MVRSIGMSTLKDRLAAARLRRARHTNGIASPPTVVARLWCEVKAWHRRNREREELARMTRRELQDLGITPGEALKELAKPFWRE